MNLKDATVIGFFSLPSVDLAEHNPDAYNLAMAGAPAGAGTCAHCGTGIRHHVIVRVGEQTAFIGTSCALKVGENVARCARDHLTSAQIAARDAWQNEKIAADAAERSREMARIAAREEAFAGVMAVLVPATKYQGNPFYASLAEQLKYGPLSWKQAGYVAKAMFGRRNKKNADAWDKVIEQVMA